MRKTALLLFAVLPACVDVEDAVETEAIASHEAPPYCPISAGHWDPAVTKIDVWVARTAVFQHADFTTVTDAQLSSGFRVLLNELSENIPSELHLDYRGRMTTDGVAPGAITIRAIPGGSVAYPLDEGFDGDIDRCTIDLGDNALNSSTTLHELMHCLGFAHPHSCNTHAPSIMGYSGVGPDGTWRDNAQVFRQYDIDGLHWAFGYRGYWGHAWAINATGATWTELTSSTPFEWSRGPVSSCNGLATNGDQLLFTNMWSNKPQRMDVSSASWTNVPSADSMTAGAVACDGNGGYMAAYIDQNTGTGDATHDAYIYSGGSGATQNVLTSWNGVSDQLRAAHDPASGRYVVVYDAREPSASGADRPRIDVKVVGGGNVTSIRETINGNTWYVPSVGTPNIACGAVSVVGAENCLVAWVDGEWRPRLRWVQGHIDTTTNRFVYSQANIRTGSQTVWGGPAIAYTGSASAPWLLVYHYGDRYLMANTKSASLTSSWQWTGIVEGPEGHRFQMPTILSYRWLRCSLGNCNYVPVFHVYAKSYPLP